MANEKIPLTYKGHPLRRKDNIIYYGDMSDSHIIQLQILDTKPVGDLNVATKVSIQLQLTSPDLKGRDRVVKRSEKDSLYAAIDIASVWLDRALVRPLTPRPQKEVRSLCTIHRLRLVWLAMSLLAASALSVSAFAAPVSSSTAIRVDRDPTTNASSSVTASTDSPVTVDPSQASGQIKVVYQDANGVERTATIAARGGPGRELRPRHHQRRHPAGPPRPRHQLRHPLLRGGRRHLPHHG